MQHHGRTDLTFDLNVVTLTLKKSCLGSIVKEAATW